MMFVNETPNDQKWIAKFSKVLKGKYLVFVQLDIEAADELYDRFREIAPLFFI